MRAPLEDPRARTAALAALIAAGSVVLLWGIAAKDSGFRPTAPAALVVGIAVACTALVSRPLLAAALGTMTFVAAAALWVAPAHDGCDLPIVEFVPHALEDGGRTARA